MALSVFPELMDKIDPQDTDSSLRTIESYINYIVERVEFSLTNTFRTTTTLGSSAEAISLVLEDTVNKLSEATSQLAILDAAVKDLIHDIKDYEALNNKPQIASVELVGNKSLAQFGIASQADHEALEGRVFDLEDAGGEANVIEIVKQNGTALPVSGKAVNVTVPTAVSDLTNDSGYQNAQQVQAAVDAGLEFLLVSDTYGPSAMASFSAAHGDLPLKSCVVAVQPVQSGSGTPSPSNVRPISGWTGAQVNVSPTTTAGDGKTYALDWSNEAGTVYGGTLDVLTGILTVDKKILIFDASDNRTWGMSGSRFRFVWENDNDLPVASTGIGSQCICSDYKLINTTYAGMANNPYCAAVNLSGVSGKPNIVINDPSKTSPAEFKAGLNNMQVVVPLAEPITYQLTPHAVTILEGQNNIWADCGNVTVEYGAFLAALQAEIERLQEGGT